MGFCSPDVLNSDYRTLSLAVANQKHEPFTTTVYTTELYHENWVKQNNKIFKDHWVSYILERFGRVASKKTQLKPNKMLKERTQKTTSVSKTHVIFLVAELLTL